MSTYRLGEVADHTLLPGMLPGAADAQSSDALTERPEDELYGYSSPRGGQNGHRSASDLISGVGRGDVSAHRGG